jgi:hypothetical protein
MSAHHAAEQRRRNGREDGGGCSMKELGAGFTPYRGSETSRLPILMEQSEGGAAYYVLT